MRRRCRWTSLLIIGWLAGCSPAVAQQHLSASAEVVFYGDNTEFRNPFREGETIFGAAARGEAAIDLGDRVRLSAGVLTNQRFGSDSAFELVRPLLAVAVRGRRSTFILGTLQTPLAGDPAGPDRTGPHGLLPPMQRETLAFDRPFEAGMQWLFAGARLRHDMWLQWQRLNTPEHRERLDAGARADFRLGRLLTVPLQAHIVHEGGQLYASGPVRDSLAMASGVKLGRAAETVPSEGAGRPAGGPRPSLELLGLWSRYTPDRQQPQRTRDGAAFFGRAAVEWPGWRAHLLMWRGNDFIKDEGDANYQSIRRDGSRYRNVRDYAEAGVTRSFVLVPQALLAVAVRYHRVEHHYEYSYRLLAVIRATSRRK
jgi:hypothetical protein